MDQQRAEHRVVDQLEVVLDDSVSFDSNVLAVSGAHCGPQLFVGRVLEAAKDDLAFVVVAAHSLSFRWSLSKPQIQLQLGTGLDKV